MAHVILRLPAVRARIGLSRSAIYALMAAREFPRAVLLGTRSVGWIESEVEDWIEQRIKRSRRIGVRQGVRHGI